MKQRHDYIFEFLRSEGYRPEFDSSGRIVFSRVGRKYLVGLSADDIQYYEILDPSVCILGDQRQREWAHLAASVASRGAQVAQVFVSQGQDCVVAVVASFHHNVAAFTEVFERLLAALIKVTRVFDLEMYRLQQEASAAKSPETVQLSGRNNDSLHLAPLIIGRLGQVHCKKCGHVGHLSQQGSHCYNLRCAKCGSADWQILTSLHH